ncbi:MAG: DoxX family protein [Bacteroidales bacterium]|nr:DoxX family protein [Bacteroidales bacterium]
MKWIANVSRILIGIVFIFSGFVKGVDPLGFGYKLEDYFIAFNWQFLIPFALFFSIALCTIEFVTGVMVLLNLRLKIASWLLLAMMAFFTLLTLNDALYSPVPDCGCFGDAIKLTNWQTFYKNLILLPLAMVVFIYRKKFKPFTSSGKQWLIALFFVGLFSSFSYLCFSHLPVIDFTEWKVGHKLYPENPKPVKYFLTYKNKFSGEEMEFLSPNYPFSDSVWMANWEFVSQRVEDPNMYFGKSLIISDTTGNNVTESIIRNPDYQLIVNSYDLSKADATAFIKLSDFSAKAYADNIATAVLVSSTPADIAKFVKENKLQLDFYTSDDIALKTIVRSNPGLLLMKNGVILKKWHYNDFPDYAEFKKSLGTR